MISLNGAKLALMAAVVARVANDDQVRWKYKPHHQAFDEICPELDAQISVYDIQKIRYVKFDFNSGEAVEVAVGPSPVFVPKPVPTDDPPPTTTGPSDAPRLAVGM